MLVLEGFVEALGDALTVERIAHPMRHAGKGEAFLFVQAERYVRELLYQRLRVAACQPKVLAEGVGPSLLARNPLPDLLGFRGVRENDEMLENALGDLTLDFLAGVALGNGGAVEHPKAAFFGDRVQLVGGARDVDTLGLPRRGAVAA